ncbi:MerR family transcriptional regulator [soil metagenome]
MMKQWYAKELSKLTQVSVRTLHHYDKIDLLKPSLRLSNGYRLYSEKDLLKLQQIIALKFFGFELAQIKMLLANHMNVLEHFAMQSKFLQEKAETLTQASTILKRLTSDCSNKKFIPWEHIIQLIEVYRMTQQLENSWVKDVLNPEELKQYVKFEERLQSSTKEGKALFEKNWFNLINEIKNNLQNDPTSEKGIKLGEQCLELIDGLYGKENLNLRTTLWEKGFKEGKNTGEHGLTPEIVSWLDKAMDSYWRQRLYAVLSQVGKLPSAELAERWNQVLEDMYGDAAEPKAAIFTVAMTDKHVSHEAREWLKKMSNL